MSKFLDTMKELGYEFDEQDGRKLTYKKKAQFSDLVLIIDLERKTVRPVSVPVSFFLYRDDFVTFYKEHEQMLKDVQIIEQRSEGKLKKAE